MSYTDVYRASSAATFLKCPGSVKLSRGLSSRDDKYNVEGTLCHDYAWKILAEKETADYHELAADLQATIDYYVGVVWMLEDTVADYDNVTILFEHSIQSRIVPGLRGTLDCLIAARNLNPKKLTIIVPDFKAGVGEMVKAVENPQLLTYLFLARELLYPIPLDVLYQGIIVQPRREPKIKIAYADDAILDDFRDQILTAQQSDTLNMGRHCRWCPALTICPKVSAAITDCASHIPPERVTEKVRQEWADIMGLQTAVNALYKQLPQLMLAEIIRGEEVPGYKAAESLGNRAWKPDMPVEVLLDSYGIKESAFMSKPALRSPPQVEKEVTKDDFAKLKDLIHRPTKGLSLVSEQDAREGIEFGDILEGLDPIEEN